MRNQIITTGVVLARTDFGEADRILTIITPDYGKLRLIAKGVRRPRSKMAGGIELFSINDLTFLPGRGEIGTLISSRLKQNYGHIVANIQRTMMGYEFLKRINKITEDAAGQEYFDLLKAALAGLDDSELELQLLELWFTMQLLNTTGHAPNLTTDQTGTKLTPDKQYVFDFDDTAFRAADAGPYSANHIKLLRLAHNTASSLKLKQLEGVADLVPEALKLSKNILKYHVRV